MNGRTLARLRALEEARRPRAPSVAYVEDAFFDFEPDQATAELHRRGIVGRVLVAPYPCSTEKEWIERNVQSNEG